MTASEPITGIFVSVLSLYLGGLAVLTWVSYRKTDSVKEFLAMGGTAGSILTGFAYFATQFSRRDRRYAPVFAACFLVPWLPVPFVFPWKRYLAGWFGVPVFVWVWPGIAGC